MTRPAPEFHNDTLEKDGCQRSGTLDGFSVNQRRCVCASFISFVCFCATFAFLKGRPPLLGQAWPRRRGNCSQRSAPGIPPVFVRVAHDSLLAGVVLSLARSFRQRAPRRRCRVADQARRAVCAATVRGADVRTPLPRGRRAHPSSSRPLAWPTPSRLVNGSRQPAATRRKGSSFPRRFAVCRSSVSTVRDSLSVPIMLSQQGRRAV